MQRGNEPLWEAVSSLFLEMFKGVVQDLREDVTFRTEGHGLQMPPADAESFCLLTVWVICTWGSWSLFLRSFNHFYCNNLCALSYLKSDFFPVSHKFWMALTSPVLLGCRELHESCWSHLETRGKDSGPGPWFHTCVSCEVMFPSWKSPHCIIMTSFWVCFHQ